MNELTHARVCCASFFFFFNDTATTEIYTLSLHDALPISCGEISPATRRPIDVPPTMAPRSEEHTSELQSLAYLVCRLLLEKKKQYTTSAKVPCYIRTKVLRAVQARCS